MDEEEIDIEDDTVESETKLIPVVELKPEEAEEYPEPSWITEEDGWRKESDVDPEQQALIEGMIAEERLYFGRKRVVPDSPTGEKSTSKPVEPQTKRATHNQRWSKEENELFRIGLERHGHGAWKLIAKFIGTRNALQVKNHAKHFTIKDPKTEKDQTEIEPPLSSSMPAKTSQEEADEEEEIDILEADEISPVIAPPASEIVVLPEVVSEPSDVQEPASRSEEALNVHEDLEPVKEYEKGYDSPEYIEPLEERALDLEVILPEEIEANAEFFAGNSSKTPERYLKIRNHIVEMWLKCRPKYLTKTSVRPGLKDCGDVNAIGRVHSFLERIGTINFGCAERPRHPIRREYKSGDESLEESSSSALPQSRTRRIPARVEALSREQLLERLDEDRLRALNAKYFAESQDRRGQHGKRQRKESDLSQGEYDPFRLVLPERYFFSEKRAPFQVDISSNVLLIIDFHSHLAHTEIIGLLGGSFVEITRRLMITEIFPCNSISTGLQCEMDPSSEMEARDYFAGHGLEVVGWYHSHPTFEPNPSIRDIENQTAYQTLFRRSNDLVEPFIGIIASPYDADHPSNVTSFQYVYIEHEWDPLGRYRLPYLCDRIIRPSESLPAGLFVRISDLVRDFRSDPNKVDLFKPFRKGEPLTKLEKLLSSLAANIYTSEDVQKVFLDRVRDLLVKGFMG